MLPNIWMIFTNHISPSPSNYYHKIGKTTPSFTVYSFFDYLNVIDYVHYLRNPLNDMVMLRI